VSGNGVIDVAFVTTNPGKFREAEAILRPYGVRLRWLNRRLMEPQSEDLGEVALAKARSAPKLRGWLLVEDSGLFIRSLAGFPGVYSAHFLKLWGFPPILRLLRGERRGASFRSVAVLRDGRTVRRFVGQVSGSIARRAAGSGGFGYDPIFVPRGYRLTFAELPPEAKNRLSHRGRSMRQAGRYLARTAGRDRPGSRGVMPRPR
jgi:XTP/dITP diphosphohydrolase